MQRYRATVIGSGFAALCLASSAGLAAETVPAIKVTIIPPAGPGGEQPLYPIAGTIEHAPAGAVVVIWAHSIDNVYWIQPRGNFYRTQIGPDGSFSTVTHAGLDYSVAVALPDFTSPMVRQALPPESANVLALITIPGKSAK